MYLILLGINHTTAPIALRERLSFARQQLPAALQALQKELECSEAAILSTCNRTELLCTFPADQPLEATALHGWLERRFSLRDLRLSEHCYVHRDEDAVRHMMEVAGGLDSMVFGEPQILGQMKEAYALAQQAGSIGPQLRLAFQYALSTAKRIRTHTAIGRNPVSVAHAAIKLMEHIFTDLRILRALLIGGGEIMTSIARYLQARELQQLYCASRTLERAAALAQPLQAHPMLLTEIPQRLVEVDIVVSCTASQLPLLGKGMVENALHKRRHRPICMIDLAVPRDVEAQVGKLADVYLYNIDDLRDILAEHEQLRRRETHKANLIINRGLQHYRQQQPGRPAPSLLKSYRRQAEQLRDQELERARRQLEKGVAPQEALQMLAHGLTNKLLHQPSITLRQAQQTGQEELLEAAEVLFGLPPGEEDSAAAELALPEAEAAAASESAKNNPPGEDDSLKPGGKQR